MDNFADRLIDAVRKKDNCICVGLDPRLDLIPAEIFHQYDGLSYSPPTQAAATIKEFNKIIIDIVANEVVAVKPQSAFYEQYGYEGVQALEQTIYYAHKKGLIVILDVKRGDIASTAEAYANAYLKNSPADAITVNPYMGEDSITPFVKVAQETGKGIFVLVKTSNAGSKDFQDRMLCGSDGKPAQTLYQSVADRVISWGKDLAGKNGYSSVGAVVGATFPEEAAGLRKQMPNTIFLVPGYGAQGATAKDLKGYFNKDGLGAIVNASRSIIYAYKDPKVSGWQEKVKEAVQQMKQDLSGIER